MHIGVKISSMMPTIQYVGYFLLKRLSGQWNLSLTDFQKSIFRVGYADAGVLVIILAIALVFLGIALIGNR